MFPHRRGLLDLGQYDVYMLSLHNSVKRPSLHMKLSPRTLLINMRVSPDFKAAAEAAAMAENRSLTSFVEKLILDHIRAMERISVKPAGKRK